MGPATCLFAIKAAEQMVADGRRRSQPAEPARPATVARPAEPAESAEPPLLSLRCTIACAQLSLMPTIVSACSNPTFASFTSWCDAVRIVSGC